MSKFGERTTWSLREVLHAELLALIEYANMKHFVPDEKELRKTLESWANIDLDFASSKTKDENKQKHFEKTKDLLTHSTKSVNDMMNMVYKSIGSNGIGEIYKYGGSLAAKVSKNKREDVRPYSATDTFKAGGDNWFVPNIALLSNFERAKSEQKSMFSSENITECKEYFCLYRSGQNIVDGVRKDNPVYIIGGKPGLDLLREQVLPKCGIECELVDKPVQTDSFDYALKLDVYNGKLLDSMLSDASSPLRNAITLTKAGADEARQLTGKSTADDGDDTGSANSEEAKLVAGHSQLAEQQTNTYESDFASFDRKVRGQHAKVLKYRNELREYCDHGYDGLAELASIPYEVKTSDTGRVHDDALLDDLMIINAISLYYINVGEYINNRYAGEQGLKLGKNEYSCGGMPVYIAKPLAMLPNMLKNDVDSGVVDTDLVGNDTRKLFTELNMFLSTIKESLETVASVGKAKTGETDTEEILRNRKVLGDKLTSVVSQNVPLTSGNMVSFDDAINDISDCIQKQDDASSGMKIPVDVLTAYNKVVEDMSAVEAAIKGNVPADKFDESFWKRLDSNAGILARAYVARMDAKMRLHGILNTQIAGTTIGKMLNNFRSSGKVPGNMGRLLTTIDHLGEQCDTYDVPTEKRWSEIESILAETQAALSPKKDAEQTETPEPVSVETAPDSTDEQEQDEDISDDDMSNFFNIKLD